MQCSSTEILIVGAGPVGLALALELARHGVAFRLIDRAPAGTNESRAIGVHARTLELLERSGVTEQLVAAGVPISHGNIYDCGKKVVRFGFSELATPYPYVLSLPQRDTERILAEKLRELGHEITRPCELIDYTHEDAHIIATLSTGEKIEASYIVGADGAHSVVRKHEGFTFVGAQYPQSFLLADCKVDWERPGDELAAFLHKEGALLVAPIDRKGRYRLIVISFTGFPFEGTEVELKRFAKLYGPSDLRYHRVEWISPFHIHHRIANTYRKQNAFIIGDAAHIHSPAGGQGLNTGIQDAINLGWKLAYVVQGKGGPSLLASFEKERYPVGEAVVKGTDKATRRIMMTPGWLRLVRDQLFAWAMHFAPTRTILLRRLSGLAISYPGNDRAAMPGPTIGQRAPVLAQLKFHPTKFDLLLFGTLNADSSNLINVQQIDDAAIKKAYKVRGNAFYLIRPDGYVASRGKTLEVEFIEQLIPQ